MWCVTLIFFYCVAAQVTSHEISVDCVEYHGVPPAHIKLAPSVVADLKVEQMTVEGRVTLNISWAINIDASNKYLTGTRIVISGKPDYHCQYNPPLAKADLNNLKQIWFHYLVKIIYGHIVIEAANLPLRVREACPCYKALDIYVSRPRQTTVTPTSPHVTTVKVTTGLPTPALRVKNFTVIFIGGLAGLITLISCYIICKSAWSKGHTLLDYRNFPVVPVPVLVVYPAKNSAFQRAVVAFAEFLQQHGGCSVAIDIWQQEKIAQRGPMRWLAEQAKSAGQVLIVSPQVETPSQCPPDPSFPESSIPAAAHDLYPLILNMVASHAKNASELARFWVVQLGDKRSCMLPLELRACKTFCLMKDLNKLCKRLHAHKQDDKKILDLMFRPKVFYSEKSTVTLREAVGKLRRQQLNVSKEVKPLNSMVITI